MKPSVKITFNQAEPPASVTKLDDITRVLGEKVNPYLNRPNNEQTQLAVRQVIETFLRDLSMDYAEPEALWDVRVGASEDNPDHALRVDFAARYLRGYDVEFVELDDGVVIAQIELPDGEVFGARGRNEVEAYIALNERMRLRAKGFLSP